MISVLMIILKIIGIILLSLIGFVFLIIIAVIFVPLRYNINVSKDEIIKGKAAISYLLHVFHINIIYENELLYAKLHLFGIPIKKIDLTDKNKNNNSANDSNPVNDGNSVNDSDSANNDSNCNFSINKESSNEDNIQKNNNLTTEEKNLWDALDELEKDGDIEELELGSILEADAFINKNKDLSGSSLYDNEYIQDADDRNISEKGSDIDDLFKDQIYITDDIINNKDKSKDILDKISEFIHDNLYNIKNILKKIYSKIKTAHSKLHELINKLEKKYIKADKFWWLITSAEFQAAFRLCKSSLFKIIRRILPKKIDLDLKFGLKEPHQTGFLMAALSVISGKIKGKYILEPDFNNKVIEGNTTIKGRIILIEIINPCIKIILDKNAQKVYKQYKKLKNADSHGGK